MTNGKPLTALPLERLGQTWGWKLERAENLTRVQLSVTAGQAVAVFQDAGRSEWWIAHGPWPTHFERLNAWPADNRWGALIVISDRVLPLVPTGLERSTLVYRPPSLTLGVTANECLGLAELEEAVLGYFARNRLSPACLTAVAVPAECRHLPVLVDFAEDRRLPLLAYEDNKLRHALAARMGGDTPLSLTTRTEAAALLSAAVRELAAETLVQPSLCLSVARRSTA
jgi:cobalamin biosynthesis protein CbiG